jgi:transcriptional regulator with XRE-family HTH domain
MRSTNKQIPPLRSIREARGQLLADTAIRAGITEGGLSRIERGERLPSLPVLYRLAVVLGLVELERLLRPYAAAAKRAKEVTANDASPARGHGRQSRPTR